MGYVVTGILIQCLGGFVFVMGLGEQTGRVAGGGAGLLLVGTVIRWMGDVLEKLRILAPDKVVPDQAREIVREARTGASATPKKPTPEILSTLKPEGQAAKPKRYSLDHSNLNDPLAGSSGKRQ